MYRVAERIERIIARRESLLFSHSLSCSQVLVGRHSLPVFQHFLSFPIFSYPSPALSFNITKYGPILSCHKPEAHIRNIMQIEDEAAAPPPLSSVISLLLSWPSARPYCPSEASQCVLLLCFILGYLFLSQKVVIMGLSVCFTVGLLVVLSYCML